MTQEHYRVYRDSPPRCRPAGRGRFSVVASLTAAGELDPRGLPIDLARLVGAWVPTRGITIAR